MTQLQKITMEVLETLKLVLGKEPPPACLHMHLIRDLKMFDDDATSLIMRVMDRTCIRPPENKWRKVGTVGEVIDLLMKYAPPEEPLDH